MRGERLEREIRESERSNGEASPPHGEIYPARMEQQLPTWVLQVKREAREGELVFPKLRFLHS